MYNKHFGFSESPFNITPNSRFYFRTQGCDEVLKIVQHGILSRKGVIVVTGGPGTGKTLLVKFLERDLTPSVRITVIDNPHTDFHTILEALLTRLELRDAPGHRTAWLDRLTCRLIEEHRRGIVACLLIDEAQDLDAHTLDELRLLANLEFQGDALLPIVLIGQPELNLKLDHPSATRIKQRIALTRTTYPLIRMEVGPYIGSRLQVAGSTGSGIFDAEAIEAIAAYSGGIPRLINSLCDNSLIRGYAAQEKTISAEMIDQAARDLRISAFFPTGRQHARATGGNSMPSEVALHGVADPRELPQASRLAPFAAPFSIARRPDEGATAHASDSQPANPDALKKETVSGELTAKTLASQKRGLASSDSIKAAAELNPDVKIFRRGAAVSRRHWIGVAAAMGSALLLLNVVGSQPLAVLYSPNSTPQNPTRGNAPYYAAIGEDEPEGEAISEALLVSSSTSIDNRTSQPIEVVSSPRAKEDSGTRDRARWSANGKTSGPVRASSIQLPRSEEPQRTPAMELPAANAQRGEGTPKTIRVTAASLLRKRPSAGAEIIATLQPGKRVAVVARLGDFYQVRSLDKEPIRGYVHREDAFFEQKK